ncbi:MAG TPA: class I SAM-dependent methyltransferase, partial [Bacteroidales bacterium]|nr:class I SAM-dependent methyltransferase [Bacteroidales bacterium]
SSRSVEIAKKRLKHAGNVMLMVSDMTDFHDPGLFDFIVLPDVLEHIPASQHRSLFSTLASHMHDNSVILIHIPHPRAIDYLRKTSPDKLQIIDQAIEADALLADAAASDLVLVNYISYSLFNKENDYAVITLRKKCAVTLAPLSAIIISARKMSARIRFLLSRL